MKSNIRKIFVLRTFWYWGSRGKRCCDIVIYKKKHVSGSRVPKTLRLSQMLRAIKGSCVMLMRRLFGAPQDRGWSPGDLIL